MKKSLAIMIALVMLMSTGLIAAASASAPPLPDEEIAAEALHSIGLFLGYGDDVNGDPIYGLDDSATRLQGLIMLTRLLGVYEYALAAGYQNPFEDVHGTSNIAVVGYAYSAGLTKGVSDTRFDPEGELTATQYLTFLLRALGYDSDTDFFWRSAWTTTDRLGITQGQFNLQNNSLIRADMVLVSLFALAQPMRGSEQTLIESLIEDEVVPANAAEVVAEAIEKITAPPAPPAPITPTVPPVGGGTTTQRSNLLFVVEGPRATVTIEGTVYATVRAFSVDGMPILWNAPANWPDPTTIAIADNASGNVTSGWRMFEIDRQGRFELFPVANNVYTNVGVFTSVVATTNGLSTDILPVEHNGQIVSANMTASTQVFDISGIAPERSDRGALVSRIEETPSLVVSFVFDIRENNHIGVVFIHG
jgi:hypothetical protein